MSTQYAAGRLSDGLSRKAGNIFSGTMKDRTVRNGVDYFINPMFSVFYEFCQQSVRKDVKDHILQDEQKDTK